MSLRSANVEARSRAAGAGVRVRLNKAKDLLLNPNYELSEIAAELGFSSLSNFEEAFARWTGEPVSTYRSSPPLETPSDGCQGDKDNWRPS